MSKRILDVLGSFFCLVAFSPIICVIAAGIALTMGTPILFRQLRPGLRGRPFTLLKFRTMRDARDSHGNLLPDAQRMTSLGRFLRRTSLDELPQLINVVKGDMSLVGPRPLLMEYLERYTLEQGRRHEVRPGITGWAQVNGRNAISWEERFSHDVWYVDHRTLWLDLRILVSTAGRVLHGEGISPSGLVTMEEFRGTAQGRRTSTAVDHAM